MPPRPLLVAAGLQLALLGGGLLVAALAFIPMAAFGWRGFAAALVCYAVVTALVILGLNHHAPHRRFGLANGVTLTRAAATALLVGVVAERLLGGVLILDERLGWILALLAAASLLLDGVDGWAARRSGLASDFGARFDMETDSLFVLALCLLVLDTGAVGAWVLTGGLMRYAFVLGGWLWPPLAVPLVPIRRRKAICVLQQVALIGALVPAVPAIAAWWMCFAALALLAYSFGIDAVWLAVRSRLKAWPEQSRRAVLASTMMRRLRGLAHIPRAGDI